MRKTKTFQLIDSKNYIVWSDTGTHFRCGEFIHFLFYELALEGVSVKYNLFAEKHGKNSRDQHFSVISNFIKQESFVKKLCSSLDIVDAIRKHQDLSNIGRKEQIITEAYVFEKIEQKESNIRNIENLKSYYNFLNDKDFKLKSTVISDLKLEVPVAFSDEIKKNENKKDVIVQEQPELYEDCNIKSLIKKNFR